jgi:DNA-binding NarL/FixJ family response regulator
MIRVVLVDDHPAVSAGITRLLEHAGSIRVVAEAVSAEEALDACRRESPDVVVTDLAMPGAGGFELIARLRQRDPRCRILVFSMHDGALPIRRALDAGALGFVTKASAPELLVQAVQAVHAGQRFVHPDLAGKAAAVLESDRARLTQLTEREFSLFRLLAQGHSIAECALALNVSAKTVSNHQSQIRDKLGLTTSAALAHLAIRCGVITPAGEWGP